MISGPLEWGTDKSVCATSELVAAQTLLSVLPHSRSCSVVSDLTDASVPTGMNTGVWIVPCPVTISPRRAAPSVAWRLKVRRLICASNRRHSVPSRVLLPTALFSGGEKVPEADEGALVLAEQWTIFTNGRGKPMRTLNFSASSTPSSAFGTFSPAEKSGGEGS